MYILRYMYRRKKNFRLFVRDYNTQQVKIPMYTIYKLEKWMEWHRDLFRYNDSRKTLALLSTFRIIKN